MRNLNLSRLARASEGAYFSGLQSQQAARIRRTLSPEELETASAVPENPDSVTIDTVASIAAQSAYRRIACAGQPVNLPRSNAPGEYLANRLRHTTDATLRASSLQLPSGSGFSVAPDASVMRALGHGRLNLYHDLQTAARRKHMQTSHVPNVYGEGAALGMKAFAVATTILSGIGISGLLYLYFHPQVIDTLRSRTIGFRGKIEQGRFGDTVRNIASAFRREGSVLSPEAAKSAKDLAAKVTKQDSKLPTVHSSERDDQTSTDS